MENKDLNFLVFLTDKQKEEYYTKKDEILDTYNNITKQENKYLDTNKIFNCHISEVINYFAKIKEKYGDVKIKECDYDYYDQRIYCIVESKETDEERDTRVQNKLNILNQKYFDLSKINRLKSLNKQIDSLKQLRIEIINQKLNDK